MNVVVKFSHLILVAVLLSFSLSFAADPDPVDDGVDVSDEVVFVKPEENAPALTEDEELKLRFSEDERVITERRNKLAAFGSDTLRAVIFKDLQRHYLDEVSTTEIEFPVGPRFDLDKLNPDLEGKSNLKQRQLKLAQFIADKNIGSVMAEFKDLNADQLADFLVRKELWLKSVSEGVMNLLVKWKMGERENPKTIAKVNKFIRFVNNAFYSAPLNVAYSNTFGIQIAGFNGVLGLAPGKIGEKFFGKVTDMADSRFDKYDSYQSMKQRAGRLSGQIDDGALLIQQMIEKRLKRVHVKPWVQIKGKQYGFYISTGATPAISFRNNNGKREINLELFTEVETYRGSLTPVLQVYVGETTGIFLEERKTGTERVFKYVRRFIPFTAIYSKGDSHMSVVGGTSLIPNIPALVETNATRYYFFRLPLNTAAKEVHAPSPAYVFVKGLLSQMSSACRRFFPGQK